MIGAATATIGLFDTLVVRSPSDDVCNLVARGGAMIDAIGRDLGRLMTPTRTIVNANREAIGRLADQFVERLLLDAQEFLTRSVDQPPERSGGRRLGRRLS